MGCWLSFSPFSGIKHPYLVDFSWGKVITGADGASHHRAAAVLDEAAVDWVAVARRRHDAMMQKRGKL